MRFRTEQHLRRQSDFRAIRESGRRLDCGSFTVWWKMRPLTDTPADPSSASAALPRVGVVASIVAVGPAVRRNHAKRWLREAFRLHQGLLSPQCDLLLVARSPINRSAFPAVENKFAEACRHIAAHSHA